MGHATDPQPQRPTPPHNPRTCQPCSFLRHPAQAKAGRALAKQLAANPFPRQAVTA